MYFWYDNILILGPVIGENNKFKFVTSERQGHSHIYLKKFLYWDQEGPKGEYRRELENLLKYDI